MRAVVAYPDAAAELESCFPRFYKRGYALLIYWCEKTR